MRVIPVTTENVEHLKRIGRSALPEVGSSHLSEAIASLLSYRSHASLLASMAVALQVPLLVWPDTSRFEGRLRELGHDVLSVPALAERLASADLPTPAWREFEAGDLPGVNAWFRSCEQRGSPYVYISRRKERARLDWDWISVDSSEDGKLVRANKRSVVDRMVSAFRASAAPRKAVFEGSAFVGQIEGLTFEAARLLASEISLILNDVQRVRHFETA
ncbi:hypothetical protein [Roseomonas sp. AR75]|uniref:hypothetical protein n=1 Tax=Roseomonas sp. AR75 TaxID=2562311 RepID=UPI0010C10F7F|nr:hypothetical protein [Roseomonas sp. AR75]